MHAQMTALQAQMDTQNKLLAARLSALEAGSAPPAPAEQAPKRRKADATAAYESDSEFMNCDAGASGAASLLTRGGPDQGPDQTQTGSPATQPPQYSKRSLPEARDPPQAAEQAAVPQP